MFSDIQHSINRTVQPNCRENVLEGSVLRNARTACACWQTEDKQFIVP